MDDKLKEYIKNKMARDLADEALQGDPSLSTPAPTPMPENKDRAALQINPNLIAGNLEDPAYRQWQKQSIVNAALGKASPKPPMRDMNNTLALDNTGVKYGKMPASPEMKSKQEADIENFNNNGYEMQRAALEEEKQKEIAQEMKRKALQNMMKKSYSSME